MTFLAVVLALFFIVFGIAGLLVSPFLYIPGIVLLVGGFVASPALFALRRRNPSGVPSTEDASYDPVVDPRDRI